MKVLIIGGVAAGASAAARLRRLSEDAEIIIVERSGYISYANCGLPYYVGGVIENKAALTLQTPESFWSRFRIEARVNTEALSIDRKGKTVHLRDLISKKEYTESYDKLILAPGAEAIVPPFPGIDSKRIYRLRHTEDAFILKEAALKAKKAIVIGGGFIGIGVYGVGNVHAFLRIEAAFRLAGQIFSCNGAVEVIDGVHILHRAVCAKAFMDAQPAEGLKSIAGGGQLLPHSLPHHVDVVVQENALSVDVQLHAADFRQLIRPGNLAVDNAMPVVWPGTGP